LVGTLSIVCDLIQLGVAKSKAAEIAATYGEGRIRDWVRYARSQSNLKNPAGFVVAKLEAGERPP